MFRLIAGPSYWRTGGQPLLHSGWHGMHEHVVRGELRLHITAEPNSTDHKIAKYREYLVDH
jgi:hypothetical protein